VRMNQPSAVQEPHYEVLDDHGHKTGEILGRSAVHQRELWHEVANVWIINSRGELLMQLRAPEVELSPNVWDVTVGTHLRPGEDPLAAASRALQDEFNLTTSSDEFKHLFNSQSPNPMPNGRTHKVLGHVFLLQKDVDINNLTLNPARITRLAWVPLNKLMMEIGSAETRKNYFPRANDYYPQLFEAFQSWM
jgi:isopentenyldiphosphate isomerase